MLVNSTNRFLMRSLFLAYIFLSISGVNLIAQQEYEPTYEDTLEVYEEFFFLDEPINLTMEFNIKEFKKARRKTDYHPAKMTNHVSDSFEVNHDVRVRARGEFRRENCTMPPYWINVRYSGIEAEEFRDFRKMKMVTRCKEAGPYADYVLKEYLLYRIYSLITDYSFRVRLVRVKYIDTGKKNQVLENWAFLIEPEEMLAKRLNAKLIPSDRLSIRTVNPEIMDLMALFQYMVGHGDFSVTGRHNLKIIVLKDPTGPRGFLPVPYDFDYAGLVDAHYAMPQETLDISSVKERYFLGACRPLEIHMKTIEILAEYQDEILDLIMNFEYLEEDVRLEMVAYIASYFVESEQDRFVKAYLDPTCR